ncbi:MAG: hypothetical protein H3C26_03110 [Rhodocyclaceae bacterium]|nr:hypothetical protein [Rhodocyclaceae bacterium]
MNTGQHVIDGLQFMSLELPCLAGLGLILLFGVILQRDMPEKTWLLPLGFAAAAITRGWWNGAAWSASCLFPVWALLLLFLASELIRRLGKREWGPGASISNYWVSTFLVIVMKTT